MDRRSLWSALSGQRLETRERKVLQYDTQLKTSEPSQSSRARRRDRNRGRPCHPTEKETGQRAPETSEQLTHRVTLLNKTLPRRRQTLHLLLTRRPHRLEHEDMLGRRVDGRDIAEVLVHSLVEGVDGLAKILGA